MPANTREAFSLHTGVSPTTRTPDCKLQNRKGG
uniref:Uncharacterized protein n=1 Tax=Anguilla anguilla TaxID=7936 RepID=A0A0E9RJF7_ANGAN